MNSRIMVSLGAALTLVIVGCIDPETVNTEAPNVFRRLGTDTYVLMYDVYGARPNNMGFSATADFVHYTDIGKFN